eukprot:40802_1
MRNYIRSAVSTVGANEISPTNIPESLAYQPPTLSDYTCDKVENAFMSDKVGGNTQANKDNLEYIYNFQRNVSQLNIYLNIYVCYSMTAKLLHILNHMIINLLIVLCTMIY